ncbi:MAG: serine/threonine protein kinase [Candidatus Obscuribacterales bacterium]|nr:serine/threonine protein kinase [Candidatus Obscuribacterales bacterium]
MTAFVFSTIAAISFPQGVGCWVTNWLIASGNDANLTGMREFTAKQIILSGTLEKTRMLTLPPQSEQFQVFVNTVLSSLVIALLWPYALRLSGFLTRCVRRSLEGKLSIQEAVVRTIRSPSSQFMLRDRSSISKNLASSLLWLTFCYTVLLGIFGFSGGPIGNTITGWLSKCIADAGSPATSRRELALYHDEASLNIAKRVNKYKNLPKTVWPRHSGARMSSKKFLGAAEDPKLRIFCASVLALYGTVPLAVMSAVFLPYRRRRRLALYEEGVLFPVGTFAGAKSQPLRLWSDFSQLSLQSSGQGKSIRRIISIKFHSGGKVVLDAEQLSPADLERFLVAIDENSPSCILSAELVAHRAEAQSPYLERADAADSFGVQKFQSTIFVPFAPGEWLPDGETRVVRQLASRPLSCVYLCRSENGSLLIAKQFFLPEDNEECRALKQCFEREYTALSKIKHSAIAQVLSVFHKDESIYLLLEHSQGSDLRSLVEQHGPQEESTVIDWALQLCQIMINLHENDPPILHRDLTPDNIIVTDEGKIKIIDFGAARQFLEGITGTIIGKQCYVPPEQLRGHASVASDIYSFACTLHYLLTGDDPQALTASVPAEKALLTPELNALIESCTEFSAELRPQSFRELKERLLAVQEAPIKEFVGNLKEVLNQIPVREELRVGISNRSEKKNEMSNSEESGECVELFHVEKQELK